MKNNWKLEGYLDKKHQEESLKRAKRYLTGFLDKGYSKNTDTKFVEQAFILTLNPGKNYLRVGGKMDRIDFLPNNEIEIVDYKTSENVPTQKEADKNFQLSLYALAATKIPQLPFNKKPNEVKLSLYFFEKQEKITTTRTAKQLADAEEKVLEIRGQIQQSDFTCQNSFFCQNCEFAAFCQAS